MAPYIPHRWWTRFMGNLNCTFEEMDMIIHSTHFFGALPEISYVRDFTTVRFNGLVSLCFFLSLP